MVDDTIVYRKIVSDVLSELPDVEVVGTANNGKIAMARIKDLKPDLIILDIEMPEMDGLEVLMEMKKREMNIGAIVLSNLTHEGGDLTIKALELGAFDFMPKPQLDTIDENKKAVKALLVQILKAFRRHQEIKEILRGKSIFEKEVTTDVKKPRKISFAPRDLVERMTRVSGRHKAKVEVVAIGVSTGGPKALSSMMPNIPPDIGVPILIVQHMPPIFTQSLANSLNTKCDIKVKEAEDGETLGLNTAFLAPGGKQMKVTASADGRNRIVRITDDPPENSCKPSADYLFRSIANHFEGRSTGVIMTGMGSDGTIGLKLMKKNGSFIIAQNKMTCTVFGMPREPIKAGIVDIIVPLDHIAGEIVSAVKG